MFPLLSVCIPAVVFVYESGKAKHTHKHIIIASHPAPKCYKHSLDRLGEVCEV